MKQFQYVHQTDHIEITNGKIDPKNYEKKLSKIEGMIKKCKDVREEIVDESLVKKLTKLENMFERLSKFIDAYENVVKDCIDICKTTQT